jgi:hypothetical protein
MFSILNLKHKLKAQSTYYYCQVFELPPSPIDLHMIRYETLVTRGNRDVFHHLILHECASDIEFESGANIGHECGEAAPEAPLNINRCLGSTIIALWVSLLIVYIFNVIYVH